MRDAPLLRRGVLHLVQQQVIEAAVQLVQHPGRAGIDQQVGGAPDQVVVVEQPGRFLVLRIGVQHRRGERHQRGGNRGDLQRQAGIDRGDDAVAFVEEGARQIGMRVGHRLGGELLAARGLPSLVRNSSHQRCQCSRALRGIEPEPVEDASGAFGALFRAQPLHDPRRLAQRGFRLPVHRDAR